MWEHANKIDILVYVQIILLLCVNYFGTVCKLYLYVCTPSLHVRITMCAIYIQEIEFICSFYTSKFLALFQNLKLV